MPFVNSAEAGKVVKLLLRKETTPLETTAQQFCSQFPRGEHHKALCAVINQLQASVAPVKLHCKCCWLFVSGQTDTPSTPQQTLRQHSSCKCNPAARLSSWHCLMLQVEEHSLLSLEERIAALYLFQAVYSERPLSENPFVSFLIEVRWPFNPVFPNE